MKITVVTVCKNAAENLEKTIKSVAAQKYDDFEYIVVDGGSTDNTTNIAKIYKRKISRFSSEVDSGIYEAMNKGIGWAWGDFVYFLNAGDTFADDMVLANIAKHLDSADIVYGDVNAVERDHISRLDFGVVDRWFLVKNSICHQAIFARKSLFEKYGMFDSSYQIAADYDWFVEMWKKGSVVKKYVPIVVANFYMDGKSSNKRYRRLARWECDLVRRKHFNSIDIARYRLLRLITILRSGL